MGGGGDAGGRAGQRHGERPARGGLGRGHAAGRMHDMQARALHLALQAVEVAGGDGHHRGVEHGRRGALELARLGIDLVRQRDEGQRCRQRLADGAFMRGVGIGMEERDGDAFDAGRLHPGHGIGDRGGVGRQHGRAGVIDPLGQPEAALRRHLRGGGAAAGRGDRDAGGRRGRYRARPRSRASPPAPRARPDPRRWRW